MDYTFLADNIKSRLSELQPDKQPLCVIRGSGGFNNQPGESYIIPYPDSIYLFNRKFSDPDFAFEDLDVSVVSDIQLKQEAFSADLLITAGDNAYQLKVSSVEIPNAELMLENFSHAKIPEQPVAANDSEEGISPLVGLITILMFIASGDGEIAEEEQEHIFSICQQDEALYNQAYEYYENNSYEDVLANLALNEQQKLCCLANILELAMVDGAYDSKEQKMIRVFTQAADLPSDKVRAVEDVLLIKNQLSVL
jgi:uncharacterized tellurite resistance protein B-like protein